MERDVDGTRCAPSSSLAPPTKFEPPRYQAFGRVLAGLRERGTSRVVPGSLAEIYLGG